MIWGLAAFTISIFFTAIVIKFAKKFQIVDRPIESRKKHLAPVPLLGGVAIWISFWLVTILVFYFTDLFADSILARKLIWVFVGSVILMIMGVLDDIYNINAKLRLIFTAAAVLVAMVGGVGIEKITNPFGGILYLDVWKLDLGWAGTILLLADVIVFIWILGMTYTTKILDGLDGLTTGIAAIGALMIYFIASGARWHQPDIALVALIFAAACVGFLVFNFNPAKVYLGEIGSLFVGYMLGVLSVISGGKFATALLVMAVPILDLIYVIVARIKAGKPLAVGDRSHLHFRLVDNGWRQRQAVIFLYGVAVIFGITTLFFQSIEKVIILFVLFLLVVIIESFFFRLKLK